MTDVDFMHREMQFLFKISFTHSNCLVSCAQYKKNHENNQILPNQFLCQFKPITSYRIDISPFECIYCYLKLMTLFAGSILVVIPLSGTEETVETAVGSLAKAVANGAFSISFFDEPLSADKVMWVNNEVYNLPAPVSIFEIIDGIS